MNLENQRIRSLLKQYRKYFKLSQNEIAKLSGLTQSAYSSIEIGKGNIDFDKVDSIAKIYGLRVWELIHPNQKIPKLSELPLKTRNLVILLEQKGGGIRNSNLNLPKRIKMVLDTNELPLEFTASDIWKLLPNEIREDIKTTRITDTISRDAFSQLINFTGKKRGREKIYRLK
ncbi:helix-turn-helix transcriptional regulator [Elizabethkingia anophelis]|nr:helix-turn-helix transcriptional regulator [Elizabethkingia anophelis]